LKDTMIAKTETRMRRAGATKKSQDRNGMPQSLEELEAGEACDNRNGYNGYAGHRLSPRTRRRRKSTKGQRSVLSALRRAILLMRSNPEKLYICAGASFAIALLITLVVSFSLHQNIDSPASSSTAATFQMKTAKRQAKFEKKHVSANEPLPYFEIIFKGLKSANTLLMPTALSPDALEEGEYFDFGDLEIRFLNEDGAGRNIMHDWTLSRTDFRFPDATKDDDVDM
jgi:hypothetical protein